MKKIENMKLYAANLMHTGAVHTASKSGLVSARQVTDPKGEEITTWTSDGNKETTNIAKPGSWILSKTNKETGQPSVDSNGHTNSWCVEDEVFKKKYDTDHPDENGNFRPAGGPQKFVELKEDVSFTAPWGEEMSIKKGGFLNVTNLDDVYGIAKDEFFETYEINSSTAAKADKTQERLSDLPSFGADEPAPDSPEF